LESSQTMHCFV